MAVLGTVAARADKTKAPPPPPNPMAVAFDAAVAGVPADHDILDIYAKAAEFANAQGAAAVPFLRQKLSAKGSSDPKPLALGMCALAALGSDAVARQVLGEFALSHQDSRQRWRAMTAVSFLRAEQARPIAEALAVAVDKPEVCKPALGLLKAIGTPATAARLSELLKGKLKQEIEEAIRQTLLSLACRFKELKTDKDRQAWAHQELVFWQMARYAPGERFDRYRWIAKHLAAKGEKFTVPFITWKMAPYRFKQETGVPTASDEEIAAMTFIVLEQEKQGAITYLKYHAGDSYLRGDACREALASLKSPAANRALESALKSVHSADVRGLLVAALVRCGDTKTASVLKELADDAAYDRDERQRFAHSAEQIEERLAGRGPKEEGAGEMLPTLKPPTPKPPAPESPPPETPAPKAPDV